MSRLEYWPGGLSMSRLLLKIIKTIIVMIVIIMMITNNDKK